MKFNAGFKCIIEDTTHSKDMGHWPSGKFADDICEMHMANARNAMKREADKLLTPKSKLWFIK